MTATDGDKDRPENIVYFLTGQGIDTDRPDQSKFDINKTTGEIFVLKVRIIYQVRGRGTEVIMMMGGDGNAMIICVLYHPPSSGHH